VGPERLIFAARLDLPRHLARHRAADLFLDTLPYNAHTTASDALWAGLPVLTCPGASFASRVAASLLKAIDVPELIAETPLEYENLAVRLATEPQWLSHIKQRLAANRLTTPLFDIEGYARHIEAAYTRIHERYHSGLPAEHIYLGADVGRPK
jgi:predicted O-linked N-acetylglucosamine transferase (SPINDLY family)